MKTDRYTKGILTVIAICLTLNVVNEFNLINVANANSYITENPLATKDYMLVPVNESSTIDVRLVDINTYDELNVNIKSIDAYDELKVNIKSIDTNDELDINIDEIGGQLFKSVGSNPR